MLLAVPATTLIAFVKSEVFKSLNAMSSGARRSTKLIIIRLGNFKSGRKHFAPAEKRLTQSSSAIQRHPLDAEEIVYLYFNSLISST